MQEGTMSDTQSESEYDEDFDDASEDDYQNDDHDSGMEEKVTGRSSDTDTDIETTKRKSKTISSSRAPSKKSSANYRTYMAPVSRRAQSDAHYRKPKITAGKNKGASARPIMVSNDTSNEPMKRILSASRKKTTKLHNVIYDLQQQCDSLTIENKDLKRNVRIQDRDLRKLDGAEAQLPMLMKRHGNEMNVLLEKYKKQKEVSNSLSENIKKVDMELLKTKDKLKEYQAMVKEKNLAERIELRDNITNLEKVIEDKDSKILELNRNITLQKKARNRSIKEKNERNEKAMQKLKALEDAHNDLLSRIKAGEKALGVNNIHSRRKQKDGKQMGLLPPQNIVTPSDQSGPKENAQIMQRDAKSRTKDKEGEISSVKSAVGDRIQTMVSKTDSLDIGEQRTSNMRSEGTEETFLTAGRLEREESDEFYNVNDGKEALITNRDNRVTMSRASMDMDSLGEQQLHEKLDEMNEKRNKNKNVIFLNNTGDQHSIKGEASKDLDAKKGELLQSQAERSALTMENHENEAVGKSDEISENAKARKLLLAKMQAIDDGENPNDITESLLHSNDETGASKSKLKKKPIFLESSVKYTTSVSVSGTETKPLDSTPNSISKPRIRQVPDLSAAIEDFSVKTRDFNKSDENLRRGVSSHSKTSELNIARNNGFQSNISANKNIVNANQDDIEYNTQSRYDTGYSPTVLDSSAGRNKTDNKKNDVSSLFGQFDDPFKDVTKNTRQGRDFKTSGNVASRDPPVNKQEEQTELFSRTNIKNVQTPDVLAVDDIEEMFVL